MSNDIPVKEIGELLDEVTNKLPKMINGLMETVYSAEAGKKMGQAVGGFYKELIDSGIPPEEALKMSKDYMLSIKELMNSFGKNTAASE
jgi:hypothetical protein